MKNREISNFTIWQAFKPLVKDWPFAQRWVVYELCMSYNSGYKRANPSEPRLMELAGVSESVVKVTKRKLYAIGLRWVKIKPYRRSDGRSNHAMCSYDFRHILSDALTAFRGNGTTWKYAGPGNIYDPHNGEVLEFEPYVAKVVEKVAGKVVEKDGEKAKGPYKPEGGSEWTKTIVKDSQDPEGGVLVQLVADWQAAVNDHGPKKHFVSDDLALQNYGLVRKSNKPFKDLVGGLKNAAKKMYPKLIPDQFIDLSGGGKKGDSDRAILDDALGYRTADKGEYDDDRR
jgi:hypothetical protein